MLCLLVFLVPVLAEFSSRCSHTFRQEDGIPATLTTTSACGSQTVNEIQWLNALGTLSLDLTYAWENCAKLHLLEVPPSIKIELEGRRFNTSEPPVLLFGEHLTLHITSSRSQDAILKFAFQDTKCPLILRQNPPGCNSKNFPYVGRWKGYHKGSGAIGLGVAELIHPNWAITAKHVAIAKFHKPNERNVELTFGVHASHKTHVKTVYPAPGEDLALVRLSQPVHNVPVVHLNTHALTKKNQHVKFDFVGKQPHLHCAFDRFCEGAGSLAWQPKVHGHNPGRSGDSGGAWLVGDVLIGVISGSGSHNGKKMGRASQPAAVKAWIDKTLGEDKAKWSSWEDAKHDQTQAL